MLRLQGSLMCGRCRHKPSLSVQLEPEAWPTAASATAHLYRGFQGCQGISDRSRDRTSDPATSQATHTRSVIYTAHQVPSKKQDQSHTQTGTRTERTAEDLTRL